MESHLSPGIIKLLEKGVEISNPNAVEIGDDVHIDRISGEGVTIYSGCKVYGASTLILRGTKIGYQGPATVDNCQIGPEVELHSGYFKESVFLKKSSMQHGAHVREGTILEEQASGAQSVGLKQTILFPFVTLGSLINFCDCLMAGGTHRRNHSEVGSAYIHFNFTPNQDKATPSLLGDVPRGVMLDQPPIFLGGQGGIVGPSRVAFGTVTAAGTILRRDVRDPGRLVFGEIARDGTIPFIANVYPNIQRVFTNNIVYIANLIALMRWYEIVRSMFISEDFPAALHEGLISRLSQGIEERFNRLNAYCNALEKAAGSKEKKAAWRKQQKELNKHWPEIEHRMRSSIDYQGNIAHRDNFLDRLSKKIDSHEKDYLKTIQDMDKEAKREGTKWLQSIVNDMRSMVFERLPTFG